MDVYLITPHGPEARLPRDLPELLSDERNLVWVDLPTCDEATAAWLGEVFGFHPLALRDTIERNHVAKLHVYSDYVFLVLHAPEIGEHGHVHYVELDQFIGSNYVVTVHGPYAEGVTAQAAHQDTAALLRRLRAGTTHPATQFELSFAIVASLIRREIDMVARLAESSGQLERRLTEGTVDVTSARADRLEDFLEDLFETSHQLLAIRTIATHSASTYDRMAHTVTRMNEEVRTAMADFADRFEQVVLMADGQREFMDGVIEFFQTKVNIHMALTADADAKTGVQQNDDMRKISAWVGIVAIPTAVTGFFGMNVPYPGFGAVSGFVASLAIMVATGAGLFVFFKRHKWL
jgi:magnesium transporter